jgi:hypothetical protein
MWPPSSMLGRPDYVSARLALAAFLNGCFSAALRSFLRNGVFQQLRDVSPVCFTANNTSFLMLLRHSDR